QTKNAVIKITFRSLSNLRNKVLSNKDKALFRDAVSDVRPLKKAGRLYFRKKRLFSPRQANTKNSADASFLLTDLSHSTITSEEAISFFKPGVPHRIFKKIQIAASLDLHGETRESAKIKLIQFIQHCVNQGYKYIRIIHGKGHIAVLKNQLCHWLPQLPEILAFQSALPQDGGAGALYVLLKIRSRKSPL
ncbi:MAG: Smr/MutS family protein, partial [Gammaproteobacteria bacterium]